MATRKPPDKSRTVSPKSEAEPKNEADLTRLYRAAAQETPPATLDAIILAESRRVLVRPKARGLFGARWAIPLSTVAVIVLSLGVVLLISEQGALDHHDVPVPLVAPPTPLPELAAPTIATAPVPPAAEAPAKAKMQPALSERAQGVAAAPATRVAKPEAKKSERTATAPATAPMPSKQIPQEQAAPARNQVPSNVTAAKEASRMNIQADVIAVQVSGQPGAYEFTVGIRSPDTGCAQYADWWEVVSSDGQLLYRRVLLHSHVDEQPFTRSGGPVPIQPETVVWVRAHMNSGGYGGMALTGSVSTGFKPAMPDAEFATGLAKQAPLPEGCDF
jgi:hypothetical protein